MKRYAAVASLMLVSLLAACQKKDKTEEVPAVAATAPAPAAVSATPAATPAVPPGEQTPEQQEMAKKKTLLDYSVMEDKYLNDIRAQWATTARASSVYGDDENKPNEHNLAVKATGPTDGNQWTNNSTDKGFDWLETGFAKPVNATEVRAVITGGQGVEAISKVELQDTDGKWNTIWEGMSDVKRDERGNRTWFVRTFDKTAYKAKGVKVTFANNLQHDYKTIDAVQLVGD
jgi:hypothetical protein